MNVMAQPPILAYIPTNMLVQNPLSGGHVEADMVKLGGSSAPTRTGKHVSPPDLAPAGRQVRAQPASLPITEAMASVPIQLPSMLPQKEKG